MRPVVGFALSPGRGWRMLRNPTLVTLLALSLALVSEAAAALGLGAMRTQSALNQPFYAEIDVFDVKADELDTVKVRLASREDFSQAGAERPHFLTRLNFTPMIGPGGQPIVQVTSREPIREPYLDFLVEVLWPQGRLVKEYTVLMDPPAIGGRRAPTVAQPQVTAPERRPPPQHARRTERPDPPAAAPRASPRPQPIPEPAAAARSAPAPLSADPSSAMRQPSASFPLRYGPVTSGSGLWKIARRMAPPDATVAQTAMALYRNNQDAFVGGNINLIKVGADLVIPTAEELFALDADGAERQFQDALAGRSVTSKPITDIPEQPELRIAVVETDDGAGPGVGEDAADPGAPPEKIGDLEEDLLLVRETSESNRQEATELRDRIRELEDQLSDIRRLLELRNEQLAQLQLAGRVPAGAKSVAPGLPEPGAQEAAAGSSSPDLDPHAAPSAPAAAASVIDDRGRELLPKRPAGVGDAVTKDPIDRTEQVDGIADSPPPGESASLVMAESEKEPMMPRADLTAADIEASDEPDVVDDAQATGSGLLGFLDPVTEPVTDVVSPWALASGVGVVIVGGLGLVAYRRRRQVTATEPDNLANDLDPDLSLGQTEFEHANRFAEPVPNHSSAPESDADTGPQSRPPSDGVRSLAEALPPGEKLSLDLDSLPESELDMGQSHRPVEPVPAVGERVESHAKAASSINASPLTMNPSTQEADVLAEADIYILYGRYREAESILLDELGNSPHRVDLKYKLAEAYIGSGNRDALVALQARMKADGEDRADPARWFTMEQELARMEPPAEAADRSAAADIETPTESPPVEPLGAETASQAITLDLDAGDIDALGNAAFHESKDAGIGVSVRGAETSRADELREQMEDLELDLRDLDMLGDLHADTPAATGLPRLDADVASKLGLPASSPELSTSSPDRDASTELGDDLDLDLDALDRLAILDEIQPQQEGPMQVLDRLDDNGPGIDRQEMPQSDALLGPALKSGPRPDAEAPLDASSGKGADPMTDGTVGEMPSPQWRMDSGPWDEAATKMDLARAYIEMEDPEAARAILQEVLKEGNEEQQGEAKTLLSALG
jgi:pilus assembly protein FimV